MSPQLLGPVLLGLGLIALVCWAKMPDGASRASRITDNVILGGGLVLFAGGYLDTFGLVDLEKVL